jgi:hypothetical protein
MSGFVAGQAGVEALRIAAEATAGELADRVLVLLTEYENSGPEFDESALHHRVAQLLAH